MRPLFIALALAVSATMSLACGQDEEVVQPAPTAAPTIAPATPSPTAKGQLWRWANVTVVVPEDSEVHLQRTYYASDVNPPDGGPVLQLAREVPGNPAGISWMLINAENGRVIRDDVRDEHREEYDAILKTLTVGALDRAAAPWPYNGEPRADLARETAGNISFLRPSPESGLDVYTAIGDPGGGIAVGITNGRSWLGIYVDSKTGELMLNSEQLLADDRDVFERWAATVKLCGLDVPC